MRTPEYTNCPSCKHYHGSYCSCPGEQCGYEGNFPISYQLEPQLKTTVYVNGVPITEYLDECIGLLASGGGENIARVIEELNDLKKRLEDTK